MLKLLLLLIFMVLSAGAQAEVFKCKKANGDTEFSDTPCKAGANSEVVPDRDPLTQKQKDEAQKKLQQQTKEANERGAQRAASQAAAPEPAAPAAATAPADGEAIATCASDGRRNSNCAPRPSNRPRNPRPVPRAN